jgi:hypothetical protein
VHVQVVDAVTVRQNVTASEADASRLKNRTLDKSARHRCSVYVRRCDAQPSRYAPIAAPVPGPGTAPMNVFASATPWSLPAPPGA